MHVNKNAQNNDRLKKLIEKYSYAPDFFDQNLTNQESRNIYGDQVLHAACVAGDTDDIKFLLSVHADVNSKGDKGYTPLHYAAEQGHADAVKILLENGADATLENGDGDLPSDLANALNYKEGLKLFSSINAR
jgi:ankyrin repeat protein